MSQPFDIVSLPFSAGFAFAGVVIAYFILQWTTGPIRITIIWVLLIAAFFCYSRFGFGFSIAINPATHQPDFRPLITATIVFSLAAIGLSVLLKAIWFHASRLMEKHIIRWVVSILTAIAAYCVLVSAQNDADDFIRSVVHITPASLPEAQRTLTVWFAVGGWFTVLVMAAYIIVLGNLFVRGFRPLEQFTNAIVGIVPIFILLRLFIAVTTLGRTPIMTLVKTQMIIDSSFTKNEPEGTAKLRANPGDALICRNLPTDAQLAFVTDEAVPSTVLVLEANESTATVNFRLKRCENTSNPESLSGGGNHPSVHNQEK